MKKTFVRIEMDLPLTCGIDKFTLNEMREIHRRIEDAQGCSTEIVFFVTREQWNAIKAPAMVPACKYAGHVVKFPQEVGACERFRFVAVDTPNEKRPLAWWEAAALGAN